MSGLLVDLRAHMTLPYGLMLGLLAVQVLLCVRLCLRARRGVPVPPHLWSGLPMVIGMLGWLVCIEGFVVPFENYAQAPPFTREQLMMRRLKDALNPGMVGCLLGASGLLWAAFFAAVGRQLRTAGRCLSLAIGGVLVLTGLSLLGDFALLFHSIDTDIVPARFPLLPGPLLGLLLLTTALTGLARPVQGPRWWRGFRVGIWAPVAANITTMIGYLVIWHTFLITSTGFLGLHSLVPHLDSLPIRGDQPDFPWTPGNTVVVLDDEQLSAPHDPWQGRILAAPADMLISELPWPEPVPMEPRLAELAHEVDLEEPDLTLRVVVCPQSTPALMPDWLEGIYPTRPMHCSAIYFSPSLRDIGDLTIQEAIALHY